MNTTGIETILSLERQRYDAMLSNDVERLGSLLAEHLVFIHSTGSVDTKQSYLASVRSGALRFNSVEARDAVAVAINDDLGLTHCRLVMGVTVRNVPHTIDNRVLAVWTREGGAWALSSVQSTPIAGR